MPSASRIAREAGFEAIEMRTMTPKERGGRNPRGRAEDRSAHSLGDERGPLAHAAVEQRPRGGQQVACRAWKRRCATLQLWGADAVLLVPAVVDARTSYRDAWTRSQRVIRERLLPMARDLKVVIAVEEVWNKFLLSPIEFARYVDEFESPWVKAYFDVGNVVFYGFPQDWIRTLGSRIVKLHLKDFKLDRPNGRFDLDEPRRRRHRLAGSAPRLAGNQIRGLRHDGTARRRPAYLKDVSSRVDRILAGEKPVT